MQVIFYPCTLKTFEVEVNTGLDVIKFQLNYLSKRIYKENVWVEAGSFKQTVFLNWWLRKENILGECFFCSLSTDLQVSHVMMKRGTHILCKWIGLVFFSKHLQTTTIPFSPSFHTMVTQNVWQLHMHAHANTERNTISIAYQCLHHIAANSFI